MTSNNITSDFLVDSHGRKVESVRVSLTDRCNFRCKYCMPNGNINSAIKEDILTFEELNRIIGILYKKNVKKVRLTGGEPSLRKDFVKFCQLIRKNYPDIELSMTTNALKLKQYAKDLKKAGMDRLNISLDILDKIKFKNITQRDVYDDILDGIDLAIKLGFIVKINAVSVKSFNDERVILEKFLEFSIEKQVPIRFIELMPFTGNKWSANKFLSSEELRERFKEIDEIIEMKKDHISQTSRVYSTKKGASIGFISSVSESFCKNCNRIRITADGNLRPCLHQGNEYSLRDPIRSGASDNDILKIIEDGLSKKWTEHPNFLALQYLPPLDDRAMIHIGG